MPLESYDPSPRPAVIEGEHIEKLPTQLREKVVAREAILPADCRDIPIPPIRQDGWLEGGWRDIAIDDCGELLVELEPSPCLYPKFGTYSAYFNQDNTHIIAPFETEKGRVQYAERKLYARKSIAEILYKIASYLPQGLELVVLDAHRLPELQDALFTIMVERLITQQSINRELAELEAQKFVSRPSISPPSPHATGATVDLAIFSHLTGDMLNFGTRFDEMGPEAALRAFEGIDDARYATPKLNRRYLYWLMRIGDFYGWPFEWWHFDHKRNPVGAHISGGERAEFGYIHRQARFDIGLAIPSFYQ